MQRLFWVRLSRFSAPLVQAAIEAGCDALVLPRDAKDEAKRLGLVTVIAEDGDLVLGTDIGDIVIHDKKDEERAAESARARPTIIDNADWTVIPLENLIAGSKRENLIQLARTPREARVALETMEVGAGGVCLLTDTIQDILDTAVIIREKESEDLALEEATVTEVRLTGLADRVCIDTGSILPRGSGALVGNSSAGMFLVHNENVENEFVAARPFRINAGAVHAYVRVPGGKTRYLSELRTGDRVLICDHTGRTFAVTIGRSKMERRPMLLIEAVTATGKHVASLLQNAETIRLTQPGGEPLSVTSIKPGDKVLVHTEEAGRHFGMAIKESITEQ